MPSNRWNFHCIGLFWLLMEATICHLLIYPSQKGDILISVPWGFFLSGSVFIFHFPSYFKISSNSERWLFFSISIGQFVIALYMSSVGKLTFQSSRSVLTLQGLQSHIAEYKVLYLGAPSLKVMNFFLMVYLFYCLTEEVFFPFSPTQAHERLFWIHHRKAKR